MRFVTNINIGSCSFAGGTDEGRKSQRAAARAAARKATSKA